MFNNEVDLLNIRLNILNKYVDYFVIVEVLKHILVLKKNFVLILKNFLNLRIKLFMGL